MENGKSGNQRQFTAAVRTCLSVRFVVNMRMNNGRSVNDMAMVKETDVRIIECENRNQNQTNYLFTFLRHYQYVPLA
jgi:hypothetical protein